jgi:hypothetical protein
VSRADYYGVVFFREARNHNWEPCPEGKRPF